MKEKPINRTINFFICHITLPLYNKLLFNFYLTNRFYTASQAIYIKINIVASDGGIEMEICLVRHGETDWNKEGRIQGHTDIPLNETGKTQALSCANYLQAKDYQLIITSPLLRARQTAHIIAEKTNLPILEMHEFKERFYGDAEGMTAEERKFHFPDGNYTKQESRESLTKRVLCGLQRLQQQQVQKIILVAHGAVINAILAALSNNEIGSGKTILANACLTDIHYTNEKWTIQKYNQIQHLIQTENVL